MENKILGIDGKPIKRQALKRSIATPTALGGQRSAWTQGDLDVISPQRLSHILRQAAIGNNVEYLSLAEVMEEREPHYAAVLGSRKRAVSGIVPTIAAASEDKHDTDLAESCAEIIDRPAFGDLIVNLLDALGKGYSIVEIDWSQTATTWLPSRYDWRDPRWFLFDRNNPYRILLRDELHREGVALPDYKFIKHIPHLRSGIPARAGLARLVAFSYICKKFTLKDWVAFLEIFGHPIRIGRYGQEAKPEDVAILRDALFDLGTSAAGMIPETMQVEFAQAGQVKSAGDLFRSLAEWTDKQISKAVLGQTMTTDDGASYSQANVHNDVRIDILKADANALQTTLNRDLIKPYIDLNFGVQQAYPRINFHVDEPADIKLLSESLQKLVPLGLKVSATDIREKLGLPEPAEDDELLMPPTQPGGALPPPADLAGNRQTALNRAERHDLIDGLGDDWLGDWQEQLAVVDDAIDHSADPANAPDGDDSVLTDRLAKASLIARGLGDVDGD